MNIGGLLGSQPATTTTTTRLPREARALYKEAMPYLKDFAANPPERYQGDTVAPFNPNQIAGQNLALGAVPTQTSLAASGANATDFLLNDVLRPESNPYLQAYIDASIRPLTERFTEAVLPGIRGEAVTTGNFGAGRQGIAEALSSRDYLRQVGDTTAKIANTAYGQGLDAQGRALALLPQTTNVQLAPALTTSGVGDVQQAQTQAELNAQIAGYNYDQLLPLMVGKELAGIANAVPGGTTQSTATGGGTSPLSAGLGAAQLGAAGLSSLGGLGAATQVASAGPEAIALMALMSDARLKHEKQKVGKLFNGLDVYIYHFGDGRMQMGVMAQDVEKLHPEAVSERAGVKMVDYSKAVL